MSTTLTGHLEDVFLCRRVLKMKYGFRYAFLSWWITDQPMMLSEQILQMRTPADAVVFSFWSASHQSQKYAHLQSEYIFHNHHIFFI